MYLSNRKRFNTEINQYCKYSTNTQCNTFITFLIKSITKIRNKPSTIQVKENQQLFTIDTILNESQRNVLSFALKCWH